MIESKKGAFSKKKWRSCYVYIRLYKVALMPIEMLPPIQGKQKIPEFREVRFRAVKELSLGVPCRFTRQRNDDGRSVT